MTATAELADRLDVRLHTHLAEDPDEDTYCEEIYGCRPVEFFEQVGWLTDRSWVAHCVHPNRDEIVRLGGAGVGVAHCPSSNMLLVSGMAPVAELLAAGSPVGLGCDGSSSTDSASLWLEARMALLVARYRSGAASTGARQALELATVGGAACLGRQGELGVLRPGRGGGPRVLAARRPKVRRCLERPRGGAVAMRPGWRLPHRRRRQVRRGGRPNRQRRDRRPSQAPPGRLSSHPGDHLTFRGGLTLESARGLS